MSDISSDRLLNRAFEHVYRNRQKDGPHSDIWSVARRWPKIRSILRHQLLSGTYQLQPVAVIQSKKHGRLSRWCAQDAIVLKATALEIQYIISMHVDARCTHLKGHGGLKAACRQTRDAISDYRYACKSDVAQYYDSMNHDLIMDHCREIMTDPRVLEIIQQLLTRVEVFQGNYRHIHCGIPKGCPLSPLIAGLMLKSLDAMIPDDYFYVRYMDDWVVLTRTRRQLRRVVKRMHAIMHRLKFKLAIDKTFIGKISRGFDFLGYRFNHRGIIGLAKKTILNFKERLGGLYESGASGQRIAQYVRRWKGWCQAGLA